MSFPRYERYKESGVDWLGEVPEHWEILPIKRLARLQSGDAISSESIEESGEYPVYGGNGLRGYTAEFTHEGNYVLIGRQGALCGNINYAAGKFWASEHAVVAHPLTQYPVRWFGELLRAMNLGQYSIASAQPGLSVDTIRNLRVPVPPVSEQLQIGNVLDRETAKIDALIEEQRRLIVLLKEKRQAVISHAVTKGLNPSASMNDSGIEWLGDIPKQWQVVPLKHVASLKGRLGWQGLRADEYTDEGPLLVTSEHFKNDRVDWERCYRVSIERYVMAPEIQLAIGDLLMMKDGAAMGKLAYIYSLPEPACLNSHLLLFRPMEQRFENKFLYYVLTTVLFATFMFQERRGTTFFGISQESIGNFPFAIPPRTEQLEILRFLESETSRIDELAEQSSRAIELLLERRSALISAAVTGKIDIRVQAAKPVVAVKPYSTGFARQLLAAEILDRTCHHSTMGRVKLQKLIHLCEYHAQIPEIHGSYQRQAAGPFDNKLMFGIASGLAKQQWFAAKKIGQGTVYLPLKNRGQHKKYLARWEQQMPKINAVLGLLGTLDSQRCEMVSTLYAAWNDFLIDGKRPTDDEIIREASTAETWHASKEKIETGRWPKALRWMREKGLVPVGYGTHTKHKSDQVAEEAHEPEPA